LYFYISTITITGVNLYLRLKQEELIRCLEAWVHCYYALIRLHEGVDFVLAIQLGLRLKHEEDNARAFCLWLNFHVLDATKRLGVILV
jgi:hypothetical protein